MEPYQRFLTFIACIVCLVTSHRISKLCQFSVMFPSNEQFCNSSSKRDLEETTTEFKPVQDLPSFTTLNPTSVKGESEQLCPQNMIFQSNTCATTCGNPYEKTGCEQTHEEMCICPDGFYLTKSNSCVTQEECGCYIPGVGIMAEGNMYVNNICSKRYHCTSDWLITEEVYHCEDGATCIEEDDVYKCSCNHGYVGDGINCVPQSNPRDCYDLLNAGVTADGVYTIYPTDDTEVQVYCLMTTNGGGWTIFQRRSGASVDFNRGWNDYKYGFGDPNNDYWLGNEIIHALTSRKSYQLRIALRDAGGSPKYILCNSFSLGSEQDKYRLYADVPYAYSEIGDIFYENIGQQFSTSDSDNDGSWLIDCANEHQGGWWYGREYEDQGCQTFRDHGTWYDCGLTNLNGGFNNYDSGGIFWSSLYGNYCKIEKTMMMIRPWYD
ncbi:microfibril-associated glycoprotein 4-like isoform X2 [Apostichopus japonicus]|uniref:microfibril-associated glycoprotein 4-like isoform X2 n=1 Tax=Stichopus japonicus TaxID=307972 RepID=UPI003AB56CBB